jgi:adenylosuccinate synthase
MSKLEIVVGAQFGSEAKGHVVQRLTERAQVGGGVPQVIRVAGPNAGHTGYDRRRQPWALRQVPVAAVTEGPARLGIAAGSEIDLLVLLDEIDRLTNQGLMANKFLWVSGEATMITELDKEAENMPSFDGGGRIQEGTDMVGRIGSTGKGIGSARSRRLWREEGRRLKDDQIAMSALNQRGIAVADSEHQVDYPATHVIIEGTQGYGLGLHAGYYPQCTSSDCRAQDFMAMAGVAPWRYDEVEVWAVARMFPIRVAGNSGPLRNETTWEDLGLPEERTTVTKKIRRVGMPDWELVRRAVRANGGAPTVRLAVTMVDQMFKDTANHRQGEIDWSHDLWVYLKDIERQTEAKVELITTGPNCASFLV